jgi:hypothetical protein
LGPSKPVEELRDNVKEMMRQLNSATVTKSLPQKVYIKILALRIHYSLSDQTTIGIIVKIIAQDIPTKPEHRKQ